MGHCRRHPIRSRNPEMYYKNADAAILMYDTTFPASYEALEAYSIGITEECGDIPRVIVDSRAGKQIDTSLPYKHFEISSHPIDDQSSELPFEFLRHSLINEKNI